MVPVSGQMAPTLQALRTHGLPAEVVAAHTPQRASRSRAQNAVAHWESSPHALPVAKGPGHGMHCGPKSLVKSDEQARLPIDFAHSLMRVGVAAVPGALNPVAHERASRASHVLASP